MMARAGSKTSKSKSSGSRSGRSRSSRGDEPRWFEQPGIRFGLITLGIVLSSGLVAWGLAAGYRFVDHRAAGAVVTADAEVHVAWPALSTGEGTWLPKRTQADLLQAAQVALGADEKQLTSSPLERVSRAMFATGWFAEPPRVARRGVDAIEIAGTWRTPAALVRSGASEYLMSSTGLCLPLVYPVNDRERSLPVILGVADAPPRAGGSVGQGEGVLDVHQPWQGADVRAGLGLVSLLGRESFFHEVAGVDASAGGRGGKIELVSSRGGRIVWGSAPGAFTPTEQADEVKIARLRHFAVHEGGIDARRDRLEIFGPQVVLDRSAFAGAR